MKQYIKLIFALNSCLLNTITYKAALAQVNVDNTLPNPSSISQQNDLIIIDGGTQNGANLFHSFQDFSVFPNQTVLFNNNLEVRHIFSRITGNSISQIDGLIQANGQANLFLMNPNGLIFGPNARLNLGGSFYGTTANQIFFEDGTSFQTQQTNSSSLLTISRPIGLSFNNPGEISVRGVGNTLELFGLIPIQRLSNPTGLSVKPKQTLALLGGRITLEGGILQTDGGHIEIGSIEAGQIHFNSVSNSELFDYSAVSEFEDIIFSDQSLVEVRGTQGNGLIGLQGKNISILESSTVLSQNFLQPAKLIRLEATDTITIEGVIRDSAITSSGIRSEALGWGKGADIRLKSQTLLLDNGGQVISQTFGAANAGNVFVSNANLIKVNGSVGNIITLLSSSTFGEGNAGNLNIKTGQLEVLSGAELISASLNKGNAGNINLSATDYILSEGFDPLFLSPSSIGSSTLGSGNAGNITINTANLIVEAGGQIQTDTTGDGQAGNIFINASESVKVDGNIPQSIAVSQITSGANLVDESLRELISFLVEIPEVLTGDSGSIVINTPNLSVTNKGIIAVKNDGLGRAGNISINADSVFVTDFGQITAASKAEDGGNINLRLQSLDVSRDGSISVQAENLGNGGLIKIDAERISLDNGSISATTESGDGGNVDLQANFLFSENSMISARSNGLGNGGNINFRVGSGMVFFGQNEIVAEAIEGNGGNISIVTPVFLPSFQTEISASSSFGVDGNVELQTPDNNLLSTIIPVQAQILEVDDKIAQNCSPQNQNRFVITGSETLPPTPENLPSRIIEYYPGQDINSNIPTQPNAVIQTEQGEILLVNLCLNSLKKTITN